MGAGKMEVGGREGRGVGGVRATFKFEVFGLKVLVVR